MGESTHPAADLDLHSRSKTPSGHGLGWRKQLPDKRDEGFLYHAPMHLALEQPPFAEIEDLGIPIWDQGQLGSCTAHGVNFALLFEAVKQKLLKPDQVPSRLMTYWGERWIEGSINEDAGAEIRDGIKFLAKYGTCLEAPPPNRKAAWPYEVTQFTKRPPIGCWSSALKFQALLYRPIESTSSALIRACLAEGYPIVIGFTCYPGLDSDEAARTGYVPMPRGGEQILGGHCVALVGYDDVGDHYGAPRRFKFRNSWSEDWGDKGYGYFDYEYMLRKALADDFWTLRVVG